MSLQGPQSPGWHFCGQRCPHGSTRPHSRVHDHCAAPHLRLALALPAVAGRRHLPQPAFYSLLSDSHECLEIYCNQKIWHGSLNQL